RHRLGALLAELGVRAPVRGRLRPRAAGTVEPTGLVDPGKGERGPPYPHGAHGRTQAGRHSAHAGGHPLGSTRAHRRRRQRCRRRLRPVTHVTTFSQVRRRRYGEVATAGGPGCRCLTTIRTLRTYEKRWSPPGVTSRGAWRTPSPRCRTAPPLRSSSTRPPAAAATPPTR